MSKPAPSPYLELARARFLEGLPYPSPHEAVVAGARTLLEWCAALARARVEFGVVSRPVDRPTPVRNPSPGELAAWLMEGREAA